MSIYKDCDIRGIYEKEITSRDTYAIGRALATLRPGTILVGGDLRLSTPILKQAFIEGLLASGSRVTDLGTIPTPALYFAHRRYGSDAAATVTASHNPPEYNGIKFMIGDAPVTRRDIDALEATVRSGSFIDGEGTIVQAHNILAEYSGSLTKRFSAVRPLHILVDAGNGCMSHIAPAVLRAVGYRVTELSCVPDGRFPDRAPDPSNFKNIVKTCEAVRACGADFGVAFDGDGDRAVFIDEEGRPIRNERSLILFIRYLLKDAPSPVVYDQKSSSAVKKAVIDVGGTPVPERSGHAFIKNRFLKLGAKLAGEVSGHFFFGELGYDDALFATLTMAELLGRSNQSLGALSSDIFLPPATPDLRMFCPYERQQAYLDIVEATARRMGAEISHLDGVRAELNDGWFLIRKSVTAEQLTFRAEASDEAGLKALVAKALQDLPEEQKRQINF